MSGIRVTVLGVLFGLFVQACHPVFAAPSADWKILKTSWSGQDEKNFQNFVLALGEMVESRKCRTVTQCLNSPANTYRASDPAGLRYYADCADFPYFVRGYFAFKNGLPFSFATSMGLRSVSGNRGDIRYSAYGNQVLKRFDVTTKGGKFVNAVSLFNQAIPDETDSGNYRTHFEGNDQGALFSDFYPVRLNREAVKPGTILYDPNGHVTMVYKVSDDGRVSYVDAHPDNSLTTGAFSIKFVRSNPGQGAGFKNWRPLELVGATRSSEGVWVGGQVRGVSNAKLSDYGVEQFFGSNQDRNVEWTSAKYLHDGKSVSYHDYVRLKLAVGELRINPVDDFRQTLEDLCESLKDRVNAVDVAIRAGISKKSHPDRLPENIYGTQGEWETYSTPSRDAQLKVSFRDLIDQSAKSLQKLAENDRSIVYSGANLAQDLLDVYQTESRRCEISYVNSTGSSVVLNLEDIRKRLFKISFDPYHCVELRWGAESATELSSCQDSNEKWAWYKGEQRLRNQHLRRYDIRMDFSVDELGQDIPSNGVATPVDVDVVKFLNSQI